MNDTTAQSDDPTTSGDDATVFFFVAAGAAPPTPVPLLGLWALWGLGSCMAGLDARVLARRRRGVSRPGMHAYGEAACAASLVAGDLA